MSDMPSPIEHILKQRTITDYFEKRNIVPVKILSGGKISYYCPFPDHAETKPSFMVYTNATYQNFWCYGCQRGYNIINLVAGLEGLTFKEALSRLADGLDISIEDSNDAVIEAFMKEFTDPRSFALCQEELPFSMMSISSLCR